MNIPATFETQTRFCRNAEQFGDGTVATLKLHTNRPTWYLRDELPWMSRAELEAVIQAAADRWTDVCDFKAVKAANEASALWVFTVARMDGPGGTLADAQAGLVVQWYGQPIKNNPQPLPPTANGLTCTVRLADDGKTLDCNIEASKPGFAATLNGKKTWQPAAAPQGIYQAGYPAQQIVIPPPFVEQDELADTDPIDEGELS
jgi:hypothetical protein